MNEREARFKANANHDDGTVPWHNDPSGRPFKSNSDKPIRDIAAFGCDRETNDGPVCPHWCGQDKCGVTLAPAGVAPSDGKADPAAPAPSLTFDAFRAANVARCAKWHPEGIASWSPSDWLTAVTGELGELASLLKMRNRERDGLPGNKFSPTDKQVADELADVLTYLDLLAEVLGVDLGRAAVEKFNEVSERVGFPDRIFAKGTRP